MNEELKKAYALVERDLRNRTAEGDAHIDIYPGNFSSVRLEINKEYCWASNLLQAIEDLSESE